MGMNFRKMLEIFEAAERDGRNFLLEHEVYEVLRLAGIHTPRYFVLKKGEKPKKSDLSALGSAEVVIKIISPLIVHKSDAGGVRLVKTGTETVLKACEGMLAVVPAKFRAWAAKLGPKAEIPSVAEISRSIRGFLVCEKVEYENIGFGSELLLGMRNTREFGPVITMSSGGLDVEYMNERLQEGKAALISSAHLLEDKDVLSGLEPLAFFGKVAGRFRGRPPLLSGRRLAEAYVRFARLGRAFSPLSGEFPFVIEEAEVSPFVVRSRRLVPLDGMCRFSRFKAEPASRPYGEIARLLRPESIGIIGVSERMNIGHIILNNILKNGFPPQNVFVIKPGLSEIEGCRCVPGVRDLPGPVDMFVLTLAAEQSYDVMKEIVDFGKARSVIIIAGGMGEKEGTQGLEESIRALLGRGRAEGRLTPVVNGGNCLGIFSKPGRYDTFFIPDYKLPRPISESPNVVYISQSGAFMISRMSKQPLIGPRYAVSLGNQLDLTASDYLNYLKDDPDARIFAVYMEGFRPADGYEFARTAGEMTRAGKTVVVYKAGRSPEGRGAASSHTASVAGEYGVCRAVLEQAGVLVARDIFEFENFIKGLAFLSGKNIRGPRVGMVSNAGFECVIMADNLKNGAALSLAEFSSRTAGRIVDVLSPLGIDKLQDVHNPLDVTPVADDEVFCACAQAVIEDDGVDCAVISPVPLTAAMKTLAPSREHAESILDPGGFALGISQVVRATEKPVIVNIDAGKLYDPLAEILEQSGIPVFRRADEALRFLRSFMAGRLAAGRMKAAGGPF